MFLLCKHQNLLLSLSEGCSKTILIMKRIKCFRSNLSLQFTGCYGLRPPSLEAYSQFTCTNEPRNILLSSNFLFIFLFFRIKPLQNNYYSCFFINYLWSKHRNRTRHQGIFKYMDGFVIPCEFGFFFVAVHIYICSSFSISLHRFWFIFFPNLHVLKLCGFIDFCFKLPQFLLCTNYLLDGCSPLPYPTLVGKCLL